MGEVRERRSRRSSARSSSTTRRSSSRSALTVDEKLHATLEQRLGESFRQVAERLEQVHRGIGEMQKLASDVGSLSRVLSNVKTRGTFGEVQLGALARAGVRAGAVRQERRDDPGHEPARRLRDQVPGPRRRRAGLAADRLQVPARGLRAPGRGARARRCRRRRGLGAGDRDAPARRGADDPRQVPGAAAHDRLRDPVRADRGPLRRGAAPARPVRIAAARPPRHARRADDAARRR